MIEKILERLETLYGMNEKTKKNAFDEQDWEKFDLFMHRNEGVYFATKIVQEVAKEYGKDTNVRSNADRIRNMTDEELAEFLEDVLNGRCRKFCCRNIKFCQNYDCEKGILQWLKSEVKE